MSDQSHASVCYLVERSRIRTMIRSFHVAVPFQVPKKHINIKKLPPKLDLSPPPNPETPLLKFFMHCILLEKMTPASRIRAPKPLSLAPSLTASEILYVGFFVCFFLDVFENPYGPPDPRTPKTPQQQKRNSKKPENPDYPQK